MDSYQYLFHNFNVYGTYWYISLLAQSNLFPHRPMRNYGIETTTRKAGRRKYCSDLSRHLQLEFPHYTSFILSCQSPGCFLNSWLCFKGNKRMRKERKKNDVNPVSAVSLESAMIVMSRDERRAAGSCERPFDITGRKCATGYRFSRGRAVIKA